MIEKIGGNMYILTALYDYPDNLNIISESIEDLQEIALSLYEEDMHEWFCVFEEEEPNYITFDTIIKKAKEQAFEMSFMYNIEPAKELR